MRKAAARDERQMGLGFSVEEMTPVPASDWRPPSELPDRLEGVVGFDLETEDRGISAGQGAGWAWRGGGKVVGYAVSADNFSGYLPIAHEGGGNMDPGLVRRWLNHVLADERQPKVGASVMYDVGWAKRDGVEVRGPIYDVQWIEALLDENRLQYSLESIARDRLNEGKDEALLRGAAAAYGVDPKSGLWKLPAHYVGPYGERDGRLARRLFDVQMPLIREQGLEAVFELEHDLLPMYVDMRWRGVRIDVDHAERMKKRLKSEVQKLVAEIKRTTGVEVSIWAAESIAKAFDAEGIPYGRTAKTGAPSITKQLLENCPHPVARLVKQAREKDKLVSTFIDGQILGQMHDGRVHGEIHPLKGDDGGAGTGRLSMSNPNLQFIPARTDEGRMIREAFLPEEGELWCSCDFSQQEPRLLVHFASLVRRKGQPLPGALEARDRYLSDPNMSYHDFAAELTGLPYKGAKILNLAIIYGRGHRTTAEEMGKSIEEVKEMFAKHAAEMPFVKAMSEVCQDQVKANGFIRSLMGRRVRFDLWEPASWDHRDGRMYPKEKAERIWPNQRLVRARIHKALNSLIQPSAADQTKLAMRAVWREGLGRHVLIQVHDELGNSVPDGQTGRLIAECMRDAVKLEVPSKVDPAFGPSWGTTKDKDPDDLGVHGPAETIPGRTPKKKAITSAKATQQRKGTA